MIAARIAMLLSVVFASSVCPAGEVGFSAKPTVERVGDKVTIRFTLSAPTDVEVALLDADGDVVRHLGAGVLGGEKTPPPPLKPGLSQELTWDGKDDFGRPILPASDARHPAPFRVRVRAGLGARFGRFLGGDPSTFGSVVGLAADEDGNVYVLGYATLLNQRQLTLRVFDPDGRYLREIIPFPADLGPEDMKDVARWDPERRTFRPRQIKNLNPEFYAGGRGWCLSLVSASKENGVVLTDGTRIYTLQPNGAVRGEEFCTRLMWEKKHIPWGMIPNSGNGPIHVAVSPDGRYVYESGPFTCKTRYGHTMNPDFPPGRVFRMKRDEPDFMREFVAVDVAHKEGVGGNWTKGLGYELDPLGPVQGIAVDRKGLVYVCDREHERVAVYDESGKLTNEVPVKYADQIAVHPTTGSIYVMQRDRRSYREWFAKLVKFDRPGKDAEPAAEYEFGPGAKSPRMALSVRPDRTVVWVAGVEGGLAALEDRGTSFSPRATQFNPRPGVQLDFNRLAVDYGRDEVYVNDGASNLWRYDGRTGEGERLESNDELFYATDLAVGYDGLLYVRTGQGRPLGQDYSGPFERRTRDLEPAPFPQTGTHVLSPYIYSRYGIGYAERGIGVGPDGRSYLSFMYRWVAYAIGGFGPDGRPLAGNYLKGQFPASDADEKNRANYPKAWQGAVIGPLPQANAGIRVDLAGDLYVGCLYWPEGLTPPHGYAMDRMWTDTVGSVLKFDAARGGAMTGKDDQQRAEGFDGVLGEYPGLAPFSKAGLGGNTCCVCRGPRFDVDRYGRLALPNAVTCSVWIYDNAGNLIAEVGRYGNFDSQFVPEGSKQRKPLVAVPDVPLAWPTGAGWSEKHLYINDTYSRRAVRVDLTYTAEEVCQVK